MTLTNRKRRGVATMGVVAIAALMVVSVAAFDLADAAKPGSDPSEPKAANKTMLGVPDLSVFTDLAEWTPIINGTIKTSTNSDLVITHFQECAIHTGLKLDAQNEGATSVVREDVRLLIDNKIIAASYGDPHTDSDPDTPGNQNDQFGIVTMCGRAYSIDTNILSKIDTLCGASNGLCAADSFFNSFIATKQTHGWQWVALDVGSGLHSVVIEAKTSNALDSLVDGTDEWKDSASAMGSCKNPDVTDCVDTVLEIGKRNLIAVEDKLAVGTTLG